MKPPSGNRSGLLPALGFLSPWLLGFVAFTLNPLVATLALSLTDYRVFGFPRWTGIENYRALLGDRDYFLPSLGNTLFMLLEVPLSIVLAVALALLLHQRLPGQPFFRAAVYLPSVLPTVGVAVIWLWVLNPEYGMLNAGLNPLLEPIGLTSPGWLTDPGWAKPGFIVMDLWMIGGAVILYLAGLQGVPRHLLEAAELDGAGPWRRTLHITLPHLGPVIFYHAVMGVIGAFQYFTQTFIMTAGGPQNSTLFYGLHLYYTAFRDLSMGRACALAWLLFLIALGATLLLFRGADRRTFYEARPE